MVELPRDDGRRALATCTWADLEEVALKCADATTFGEPAAQATSQEQACLVARQLATQERSGSFAEQAHPSNAVKLGGQACSPERVAWEHGGRSCPVVPSGAIGGAVVAE